MRVDTKPWKHGEVYGHSPVVFRDNRLLRYYLGKWERVPSPAEQILMQIVFAPFDLLSWMLKWFNRLGSTPESVLLYPEQFELDRGAKAEAFKRFGWCTPLGKIIWYSLALMVWGAVLLGLLIAFGHGIIL